MLILYPSEKHLNYSYTYFVHTIYSIHVIKYNIYQHIILIRYKYIQYDNNLTLDIF